MEHPVPQNVTSFEFHLVGDMTLKQFGYLAAGFTIAYLSFTFLLPVNILLALPLIVMSTLIGVAFAFIPIYDRPLDHWVLAFLRAVYSPTKGVWKGNEPMFQNRLQQYLISLGLVDLPSQTTPGPLPKMTRLVPTPPVQTVPTPPAPTPSIPPKEDLEKLIAMASQAQELQARLAEAEKQIQLLQGTATVQPKHTPIPAPVIPALPTPKIITVEPQKQATTQLQLTLTSLPNVINGVIVDGENNYLEGVIVIIHNSEGLPVRALKTNKLGQFSGATPLPSGTYTLTMEKESLEFEALQITLGGEVMQPLNIHSKKAI